MRPILTITYFLLNPTLSLAHISFERMYGGPDVDEGHSGRETRDGGYIITGFTRSFGAGLDDVYLIKTDSFGETLWTKTYGGGGRDFGHSVEETGDGGYIIAGRTESFGAGGEDIYLLKTDSLGDTLWTRTYGGTLDDMGWSIHVTKDGGYIIAGETWSFGVDSSDAYLIKTDSLGDILWSKTYGGTSRDGAYSVQEILDGGFIFTGFIDCPRGGSMGLCEVLLIKTDSLGEVLFTRTYGRPGGNAGRSVQETQDGGYIIAGCTGCWYDIPDIYLIKTDSFGDILWTRTYGSYSSIDDVAYSVQETQDGGYIIAGQTWISYLRRYDVFLIKTDSLGDTLWTRTYGGYNLDMGYSVQQTSDSSFIITGMTDSYGAGSWDVYLIKVDIWGPEILSACASDGVIPAPGIDADDYVLLTFDDPTNKPNIPPMFGIIDSVLALSGGHTWRDGMGWIESAIWDSSGTKLQINLSTNSGTPTVAVGDTITPDGVTITDLHRWPNPCVKPIVITCSFDPVGVDEEDFRVKIDDLRFTLLQNHPNPFHSSSMIRYQIPYPNPKSRDKELPIRANHVTLRIYDITGRLVETLVDKPQTPGVYQIQWTPDSKTPGLIHSRTPSGIYFYRLQSGEFSSTKKMTLLR